MNQRGVRGHHKKGHQLSSTQEVKSSVLSHGARSCDLPPLPPHLDRRRRNTSFCRPHLFLTHCYQLLLFHQIYPCFHHFKYPPQTQSSFPISHPSPLPPAPFPNRSTNQLLHTRRAEEELGPQDGKVMNEWRLGVFFYFFLPCPLEQGGGKFAFWLFGGCKRPMRVRTLDV
jgi:hypothetical protein